MNTRRILAWCLVLSLALGLLWPAAAGAQAAKELTGGEAISGDLPGSAAGSFAYYHIAYPGHKLNLRIQVRFSQYGAGPAQLGFEVYGPGRRVDHGDWQTDDKCLEVTYKEEPAADLLVQIHNYGSTTVSYTITGVNLPVAAAAAAPVLAQPAGAPAAVAPAAPAAPGTWKTASGVIVGSRAGAFGQHELAYAGNKKDVTVKMTVSPADPGFAVAFGLNVYNPLGKWIASATVDGKTGERKVTWSSDVAGMYYLQVFNYASGVTMSYDLQVTP
jgi:hypothetical protein